MEGFDRDLEDLPAAERWPIWMRRIEAVLFASATPVPREDLARVVGQVASIDLLIEDLSLDLAERPYEIARVADGWMLRSRLAYAAVIRAAADVADQTVDLTEFEGAVLAAVAYHQPLTRDGMRDIFGREIGRDLIARLRHQGLVTTGPRSPRPGAPHTYVTTARFLHCFGLQSLRDLPDPGSDPEADLDWDATGGG